MSQSPVRSSIASSGPALGQQCVRSRCSPALLRALFWMLLSSVGLVLVLRNSPSQAQSATDQDVLDIVSESLSFESATGEARFSGKVRAQRGEWVLQCEALVVSYSSTGELLEAWAQGPVVLASARVRIEASTARYSQSDGLVVMGEGATVRRGQSVLEAKQAVVDLRSGSVEMSMVTGRLNLGELELSEQPAP